MKRILFILVSIAALTSCGAYKRLAYLQDMVPETTYEVTRHPDTRINVGDKLGIEVMSSQPILATPFNIRPESAVRDTSAHGLAVGVYPEYEVDTKGYINFPILGMIYVEGLTLKELSTTLVDEIRATNYINDPVVSVVFTNFKITVLGEFSKPGTYDFPTGTVNIFELMAEAGELSENAQRDNIWVIRTIGGTRKMFTLNAKSLSIYDSPAFYLQQNDLVYVPPVDKKMDASTSTFITWLTTPLAFLSTIFSGMALARSFSR
ncbi:MAG: polysaccharide biosynthesis/export family protein [Bacteroidales bacterium]|nr:polysaccharide biosynthesis/export family protein [Bacteroidales bacterium]